MFSMFESFKAPTSLLQHNGASAKWKRAILILVFHFILFDICTSEELRKSKSIVQSSPSTPSVVFQNFYQQIPFNALLFSNTSTFPSYSVSSKMQCAADCARSTYCSYFTYTAKSLKCSLLHYWKDELSINLHEAARSYYSVDEGANWNMVYFIESRTNIYIPSTFKHSTRPNCISNTKVQQTECPGFYRSALLDIWNELPIKKVKLAIRKASKTVVSLEFTASGSNMTNWYDKNNIVTMPWLDNNDELKLFTKPYSFGYRSATDKTFKMTVLNSATEPFQYSPVILYAEKTPFINLTDGIEGDSLTVYISFEETKAQAKSVN